MNKLLGIYEKGIPLQYDWERKFDIAKTAGFDFIEFSIDGLKPRISRLKWMDEEYRAIRKMAEWKGMPFHTMALTANRYYPLGDTDDELRTTGIQIVKRAIEIAALLGIELIQLPAYDVNGKPSTVATKKRFRDAILMLCEEARKQNIILAVEVLEDVPHLSTVEQGCAFVKECDVPNLRLYADVGNVASIGVDPVKDLTYNDGSVIACHIKDAVLDNCRNVPYGSGLVNFEQCFDYFRFVDFQGYFVAEVWSDEDEAFVPYLTTTATFIRKHMEERRSS